MNKRERKNRGDSDIKKKAARSSRELEIVHKTTRVCAHRKERNQETAGRRTGYTISADRERERDCKEIGEVEKMEMGVCLLAWFGCRW